MDLARLLKSNLKVAILLSIIIFSIGIYYSFQILGFLNFIKLVLAISLIFIVLPFLYEWFLRLDYSHIQLKQMLKSENLESIMISEEEIKGYLRVFKIKLAGFYSLIAMLASAELTYIYNYVF